jgi:hypothetical protein
VGRFLASTESWYLLVEVESNCAVAVGKIAEVEAFASVVEEVDRVQVAGLVACMYVVCMY